MIVPTWKPIKAHIKCPGSYGTFNVELNYNSVESSLSRKCI